MSMLQMGKGHHVLTIKAFLDVHPLYRAIYLCGRPAALSLLIVFGATAAAAEGNSFDSPHCQSNLGSPPTLNSDNSYYCMSWNKKLFKPGPPFIWNKGLVMQGSFAAANNTYGARGQIHTQTMTVIPATFPNGTSWTWKWPTPSQGKGISCCDVDSFYALYWGASGMAVSAGPGAPAATQLKAIKSLTTTFDISYKDSPLCVSDRYGTWNGNFDVIFDIFLYGYPNIAVKYEPLFEIEISLRDSFPQEFDSHAHYEVTENGRTWTGYLWPWGWQRWWFTAGGGPLSGTIDLNAILQSLVAHGYATGNEWFVGVPLGSEVACGSGGLTIHKINFQWDNRRVPPPTVH